VNCAPSMPDGKHYYFAYGSNMDEKQMAFRCPGSQLVGRARLLGHSFLINERGVASVLPAQDCVTYGLLWTVTPADVDALDGYEGVAKGCYLKAVLPVCSDDTGEAVQAVVYVATNNNPGPPRPGYLEKIVRAARAHGFPTKYVTSLESWTATQKTQRWVAGH